MPSTLPHRDPLSARNEVFLMPSFSIDGVEVESRNAALQARRADLHVFLTGRDAPPEPSAIADVVTEMQAVKHPYRDGVSAQKGIEF